MLQERRKYKSKSLTKNPDEARGSDNEWVSFLIFFPTTKPKEMVFEDIILTITAWPGLYEFSLFSSKPGRTERREWWVKRMPLRE